MSEPSRPDAASGRPHEHEFEPEHGLPEPLPPGERLLWQGSPQWRVMARRIFHVRKLALYFAVILALRAVTVLSGGGTTSAALVAALWLVPPAVLAIGMALLMAWMSSRTTVYTITDRRVVMRVGVVLSLTFNLPYGSIASAGLRRYPDGGGDIPLTLTNRDKIAFAHLWPHVRPWRLARPEPMLCCLPAAAQVAQVLAKAWAESHGVAVQPVSPADEALAVPASPLSHPSSPKPRPAAAGGSLLAAR